MKSLKKFLAVFLACMMAFGVMSASVFAEDTGDEAPANELISTVDVTVAAPVDGEYADGSMVNDTLNTALSFIQWVDAEGAILYSSVPDADVAEVAFVGGSAYTVQLVLTASEGYEFDSSYALKVTVNGNAATVEDLSEDCKEIAISYTFDCETSGDSDDGPSVTFDQVLNFLKTILLTFVRFLGSLVGIK